MRLAEAAARAEAALTALAGIESARTAPAEARAPGHLSSPVPGSSPALEDVPAALKRAVTLDWIGPVETLAEALAQRAGYRFVSAGSMPVHPVMVSIRAAGTPLIEVLRDAGLQAGSAATLVVDANGRTVRLDWIGKHPSAGERPDPDEQPGSAPGQEGT
jgi:defect-in-organelle-trafficking protein DotD